MCFLGIQYKFSDIVACSMHLNERNWQRKKCILIVFVFQKLIVGFGCAPKAMSCWK